MESELTRHPLDNPIDGIVAVLAEGVLTLRIDRAEVHNSLTVPQMRYIGAACTWGSRESAVRCIVLTGTRGMFCSGADLGDPGAIATAQVPPVDVDRADLYGPVINATKPTIAAVNGAAAGGGLGLALACDVRIASANARFASAFSRIGVPANDAVPWLMPRLVGLSRTLEFLYDSRAIGADEALAIGLVSRVVPADDLAGEVADLAARFAAAPPYAVQLTKRLVLDGLTASYRDYVMLQEYASLANRTAADADIKEGVAAFLEKRSPNFRGPG